MTRHTKAEAMRTALAAAVIVAAAIAVYCNSFAGVFVYDDLGSIVRNPTIRQLWPLGPALCPPSSGETVSGRPLLNVSLAVNYALGRLDVWGYHAANLAIHIAAGLLLFGIVRRTFLTPALRGRFGTAATPLALASALLWTVHPLQSESVTYVVQRAESLAGMFYLLTLYCVIRGAGDVLDAEPAAAHPHPSPLPKGEGTGGGADSSARGVPQAQKASATPLAASAVPRAKQSGPAADCARSRWYVAAVLACLAGTATKEILVTAPLVVLLYDRTFLSGSFTEALRRRWGLYVGLVATWGLLAYLVLSTGLIARQPQLGAPDPLSYARSQPSVIVHYLALAVWPSRLHLEYEWLPARRLPELVPGLLAVGLLLAVSVRGLVGRKPYGFLGAWFLLILAPSSSILPLGQLACEHRMYLPLAAVVVLLVAGSYVQWGRWLSRSSAARGLAPFWGVYRVVCQAARRRGQPHFGGDHASRGARPQESGPLPSSVFAWAVPVALLAAALLALGYTTRQRNAVYRSAATIWQDEVEKNPASSLAHNNLGMALAASRRNDEAVAQYRLALQLQPRNAEAHNNLAAALAGSGKTAEAMEHYLEALRLQPDFASAHYNLANCLLAAGKSEEAIAHYHQAVQREPDNADAHNNLAVALSRCGRISEAIEHYRAALRLRPDYLSTRYNLALAFDSLGKTDQAIEQYGKIVERKESAEVHNRLGIALSKRNRTEEAIAHYAAAARLRPGDAAVQCNLGNALAKAGRASEAIEHYQQAVRQKPDFAEAHNNLAFALAELGKTTEAIAHYGQALQLRPDAADILNNLARLLGTREAAAGGDPARAVQLAQRACRVSGQESPQCLDTLAIAYAAASRFPEAIVAGERAAQLAAAAGQAALSERIQARLQLYRGGRPYRETANASGHAER